jgi:hypothetical protein
MFKLPNANSDTLKESAEDHETRVANLELAVLQLAQITPANGQTPAQAVAAEVASA